MKKYLEIKKLYNGQVKQYLCDLLYLEKDFCVVRYLLDRNYQVDNLILPKGCSSLGFFWTDRPYNIYQWYDRGEKLATYFNISDRTKISKEKVRWRDLLIDILIVPGHGAKILDKDELHIIQDQNFLNNIFRTENYILQNHEKIIAETETMIKKIQLYERKEQNDTP